MQAISAFSMILFLTVPSWTQVQPLCGDFDQVVCLTNSTGMILNCDRRMEPGTALVLHVPGLVPSSPTQIGGSPQQPYWFAEPNGQVADSEGNMWSSAQGIWDDDRGNRAIAFTLQTGSLLGTVEIDLHDIQVCEFISDGPRDVVVTITLFGLSKAKTEMAAMTWAPKQGVLFEECDEYNGYSPAYAAGDRLFVVNPHDASAAIRVGDETIELLPHQQMELDGGQLNPIVTSKPLAMLVWSDAADLDLVAMGSAAGGNWVLPHLASQLDSWENNLFFAAGESVALRLRYGDGPARTETFSAGLHAMPLAFDPQTENAWVRINSNQRYNPYLQFRRIDGIPGSAALNGAPITGDDIGFTRLVLPHVASDHEHFWTGACLTNPGTEAAELEIISRDASGTALHNETRQLAGHEKLVGVIGQDLALSGTDPAWIEIRSSRPILGVELFGGVRPDQPYLAGFLLPGVGGARVVLPKIETASGMWSGLALLNAEGASAQGQLVFYDREGGTLTTEAMTLDAGHRITVLVPQGAKHASWIGDPLVVICLIGDEARQVLGAYLGLAMN